MICAHCQRPVRGYATVDGEPLCHPTVGLDCYHLVTVAHHDFGCPSPYCQASVKARGIRERDAVALD